MPIGDSITIGQYGAYPYFTPGGYREAFYQDALSQGITFQFQGPVATNPTADLTVANQQYYLGYTGQTIVQLQADYDSEATETNGDFENYFLLMAGPSDIALGDDPLAASVRYAAFVADLRANDPTADIICGGIGPDQQEPVANQLDFNSDIQQVVYQDQLLGWNVDYSDVGGSYTTADMIDLLHPNQTGDNLLGAAWLSAVENYSNTSQIAVPEPASLTVIAVASLLALGRRRLRRSGPVCAADCQVS